MDNEKPQITLTIDGQLVSVPKGTTVYHAATQHGSKVPIFCYQDRMPPFGACRVCLVEVEKAPKLQTSCTLEATEGMVVHTKSQRARQGQREIIELLLINHPLDCPICDRAGECPLQENTMDYGPGTSHFYEEKRRFKKPLPLGPLLMLDRERCIACARCTRFCEHLSADSALVLLDRGYRLEVGTPSGGPAESKFIGNTIMICPVGALTSEVYRFRARPWDNKATKSCCTLCPVGCSLYLDARDGVIMRTRACLDKEVNDTWLCDKGWFGYEFSYSQERLQKPLIRKNGHLKEVEWPEALAFASARLQETRISGNVAALGGNTLTVEENFLFQKFVRDTLSSNNIDHRLEMPIFDLENEGLPPGMEISMAACETLTHIVFLGLDITEEFPVLWLRLKQAMNKGAPSYFFGNYAPEVAPHLTGVFLHAPGEEISTLQQQSDIFEQASSGALFVGRQYLAMPNRAEIIASLLLWRDRGFSINILEGQGNSMGARFAGMRPDLAPSKNLSGTAGLNAQQILQKGQDTGWDLMYVAGANPAASFPLSWKALREKTQCIIVQDLFLTKTAESADIVFPTLSFVEKTGSFINIAHQVQKMLPGKEIPVGLHSDGEIFSLLAQHLGGPFEVNIGFLKSMQELKATPEAASKTEALPAFDKPLGNTLLAVFAQTLFDRGERMKHNPHLLQMVKEPAVRLHPDEARKYGLLHQDLVCVKAANMSINILLQLDKNVAKGTAVLPLGFEEYPFAEMNPSLQNGFAVTIHKAGE